METKRLFIGVGFSDEFIKATEIWVKKIKKSADQKETALKWALPTNYHVTLVFLGDTLIDQIPVIEEKMREAARAHSAFKIKVRGIGGFPTVNQARVIYLGVQRSQAILDLQSDLEGKLLTDDKIEHDYVPHLTLARLRNPKSCRDLLSPFGGIDLGKQSVSSIRLYSSILSNGYPIYELISEIKLKPPTPAEDEVIY